MPFKPSDAHSAIDRATGAGIRLRVPIPRDALRDHPGREILTAHLPGAFRRALRGLRGRSRLAHGLAGLAPWRRRARPAPAAPAPDSPAGAACLPACLELLRACLSQLTGLDVRAVHALMRPSPHGTPPQIALLASLRDPATQEIVTLVLDLAHPRTRALAASCLFPPGTVQHAHDDAALPPTTFKREVARSALFNALSPTVAPSSRDIPGPQSAHARLAQAREVSDILARLPVCAPRDTADTVARDGVGMWRRRRA